MSIKSLICLDIHKHSSVPQDGFYFILFDIDLKRDDGVHVVCNDDVQCNTICLFYYNS